MSSFLRWVGGRQAGSYSKMALIPLWLSKMINADAYILRFPKGCSVMGHRDPVSQGYSHHRINITLSGHDRMYIEGPIWRWWRIDKFRPDMYYHGLSPTFSKMYMLSVGYRI